MCMYNKMKMKAKLQPKVRTQLQLTTKMKVLAACSSLGIILIIILLLYNVVGSSNKARATGTVISTVGTGNWNNSGTWDLGRVPVNGDEVVIQSSHNVMVTTNENINGIIKVYGTLTFINGKITMDSTSSVQIHALGQIIASGPGNSDKITIGSYNWSGNNINLINAPNLLTNNGASGGNPLPIQLLSFEGFARDNKIVLDWKTASERNNEYFTIERNTGGQEFEAIGRIKGAGNSTQTMSYTYEDQSAGSGTFYYRLKQTDFDGKFEYSPVISVNLEKERLGIFKIVSAGPNPFTDNVNVEFDAETEGASEITLTNINGAVVSREVVTSNHGRNRYELLDNNDLPKGIYFLSINQNGESSKPLRLVKN